MAIFVAFAWMIEAAEYLGLIETEAQDPESRAYRLAHHSLAVLKTELIGVPIDLQSSQRLLKRGPDGNHTIEARGTTVMRHQDGEEDAEQLLDLGPGGGVSFLRYREQGLEIKIHARTDDGGAYDVNLILPAAQGRGLTRLPPPQGDDPSDSCC